MNNIQAKLFKAELDQDLESLDLHGFYPNEALEKLELFLFEKYQHCHSCEGRNLSEVFRIIYGGGTGKLRDVVLEYLNNHELVDTIKDEGGSCIVIL